MNEKTQSAINAAVRHARTKHPQFTLSASGAVSILVEEVGEVAKEVNENNKEAMREEVAHVAAVCVRMLEEL